MRSDLLQNTIEIQHQASDPSNSAWVFASAGSGKTKVLIDRILRLLLDGVLGGRILCVTFTKVAANEMQERVTKVLQNWSLMPKEQLKVEIEGLTGGIVAKSKLDFATNLYFNSFANENKIKIVTIHSLCQDILKIFPFESGVNPNFAIMDQMLEQELLQKSKKEVFRAAFADKNLAQTVTKISQEVTQEELLLLVTKFLSNKEKFFKLKDIFGNVDAIFDKILQNLGLTNEIFHRDNFEMFKNELNFVKIDQIVQKIIADDKSKVADKKFADFFLAAKDLNKEDFVVAARSVFVTVDGSAKKKILTKKFEADHDFAEQLQSEFIDFFDLENSIVTAKMTGFAIELIDKILQKYQELKSANCYLDYGDLIIKALKLLKNPTYKDWVRYRLDGFYDHILIDESQDTNDDQWSVIEALSEEFFVNLDEERSRSIFVIGDEKQSIFSFQGADPQISSEKYGYYENLAQNCNRAILNLTLNNSFRSTDAVLNFVDDVFQGRDDFIKTQYCSHQAVREAIGNVELWPWFYDEDKEKKGFGMVDFKDVFLNGRDLDESKRHKKDLAIFIAKKIKSWIAKGKTIEKRAAGEEVCALKYSDIMIVLRNQTNGFAEIFKDELLQQKIPFDGDQKVSFEDNLILLDLLSVLKFVTFAIDDLNLAALLKSSFFRVSEQKILEICNIKNSLNISLFEVIFYSAKKFAGDNFKHEYFDDNEIIANDLIVADEYLYDINSRLCEMIKKYQNSNILQFYLWLINDDYKKNVVDEFECRDLKLIDEFLVFLAQIYSQEELNGHEFLKYIEDSNPLLSIKQDGDGDAVKITTIHSAKGLQSPVVIAPDCCFTFNKMPSVKENLIWLKRGDDFNGSYELPIWLARKKNSSKILDIELKNRSKMLKNEYLRLFYVALTRAENELYIAGFGNDNDPDSWYNIAKNSINNIKNEQK